MRLTRLLLACARGAARTGALCRRPGATRIAERRAKSARGFTLAELLVASSAGAILFGSMALCTGYLIDTYSYSTHVHQLTQSHYTLMQQILASVARASEAQIESATSLLLTASDGSTQRYALSEEDGSALYLYRDGDAGTLLSDQVSGLTFAAVTTAHTVLGESTTNNVTLLTQPFTGLAAIGLATEEHMLEPGTWHGIAFKLSSAVNVEKADLTSVIARISRVASQTSTLRVALMEGLFEDRPRPFGGVIAVRDVGFASVPIAPVALGPGGQIIRTTYNCTIALPAGFTIEPERCYCLLFGSGGTGEAGWLQAVRATDGQDHAINNAFLGTHDGGATWEPALGGIDYRLKEMPIHLTANVTFRVEENLVEVAGVKVDLELADQGIAQSGVGSALLRSAAE